MSDLITQPAPTLEETEAALAKIDPKLACILRARMGLAPAEPELPKAEPEPSAASAVRARLADIDPTAHAINPEALDQLNAEIEAKAKAEQEAAARKSEPVPVSDTVAAALEPAKARARRVSPTQRRMIESSVQIRAKLPNEIVYQHSVFCQTVLPYRDPGLDVRKWERQQGNALLQITAGEIADKRQQKFIPVGLPCGPAARLILTHVNTRAIQTQDRMIDTESGLTAFVRRLKGFDPNGYEIRRFKEQLVRLSVCLMRFAFDAGPAATQIDMKVITAFDVWEEDHEGQRFLFPQRIALSAEYFLNLIAHAVPLDERAVAALAHSAMGLDVYMWLAQRLHRVDPQRPQFIPWSALYAQFGQGYNRVRAFRAAFLDVLKAVKAQYLEAHVKANKEGLLLGHSLPPVPSRRLILLPPAPSPQRVTSP